jgi:hypothetical protein
MALMITLMILLPRVIRLIFFDAAFTSGIDVKWICFFVSLFGTL